MEPQIRYCTTSDGVSIAWGEAGQGPALLYLQPTPFSHVQQQFALNEAAFTAVARSFRLIMFDARGTGLSERDVAEVSTATLLMDAEAVIDAAKLDRFAVVADMNLLALWTALQLATVLPERVTHLFLEQPYQNMRELADTPYGRVGPALAEADWGVYVQTLFRVLAGFDSAESTWLDPLAKAAAGWVDPAVGRLYGRIEHTMDVGDLLPRVRQPTLVMRQDPSMVPARSCQRIAGKIPGAQFRQYSDPNFEQWPELIRAFVMQSSPEPAAYAAAAPAGALRTVLFTDIVGHTEMMQRLGDARGRDVLREHERITRETLKTHGGAEVKTMGDGFLASFGSVTSAMECAIALQRAFAEHTKSMPEPLHVRVGLNAGEPIEEGGDLFGATVILASRIAAQAGAGEILVPDTVRGLLSGKNFLFSDRGEFVPKGFDEGVRLWDVRWQE